MPPPMVIFGYGNPGRGDDALGPLLLERLERARADCSDWQNVQLVADFQLQVEHVLDLPPAGFALFADASADCETPIGFSRIGPRRDSSYTSHALSPGAVLFAYEQARGERAPPAYLLAMRGERFELGATLSAAGGRSLYAADRLIRWLIRHRSVGQWDTRVRKQG